MEGLLFQPHYEVVVESPQKVTWEQQGNIVATA